MDFSFSAEQEMLRQSARALLEKECTSPVIRRLMDDPTGYAPDLWQKMAELGWLGLTIPEVYGGFAGNLIDLVVVMEEMGRVVLPAPYLWTVLFAEAVACCGTAEQKQAWLPQVAGGKLIGTLAVLEASANWDIATVAMAARPSGGEFHLHGKKFYVNDAQIADYLLVAARTSGTSRDGISLFVINRDRPGITVKPLPTMDRTRKLGIVEFADVRATGQDLLGPAGGGAEPLAWIIDVGKVALAAEMVGGAQRVLDMVVAYARIREQFGRQIGSFQAVQHKCANMLIAVERARSVTYYGAWALSNRRPDAALAAATAKAAASDSYRDVAADGIQLHGGIGFTWEHDMHLYFKRAKSSEFSFGDAAFNRELIARFLERPANE